MQKSLENLNIHELENLKDYYQSKVAEINNRIFSKNEEMKKRLEEDRLPKAMQSTKKFKERVTQYLYSIDIRDFSFLDYNMRIEKSFNDKGYIYDTKLIFLDEEMKKLVQSYGIKDEDELFHMMLNYQFLKKEYLIMQSENYLIMQDEDFIKAWKKANTLGHLDKIFQNEQTRLDYQGTYAALQYIKKHIEERLSVNTDEKDNELVWKDYAEKKIIVTQNLAPIATYILAYRRQIEGARIFINNGGLSRIAKKRKESIPTYPQEKFIDAVAFGTTLEKLQQQNYEDTKLLIYVPKK